MCGAPAAHTCKEDMPRRPYCQRQITKTVTPDRARKTTTYVQRTKRHDNASQLLRKVQKQIIQAYCCNISFSGSGIQSGQNNKSKTITLRLSFYYFVLELELIFFPPTSGTRCAINFHPAGCTVFFGLNAPFVRALNNNLKLSKSHPI